jgi:hypothetical protein
MIARSYAYCANARTWSETATEVFPPSDWRLGENEVRVKNKGLVDEHWFAAQLEVDVLEVPRPVVTTPCDPFQRLQCA